MNTFIIILLISACQVFGCISKDSGEIYKDAYGTVESISAKELAVILQKNSERIWIIDMRERKDYESGHIPGAINSISPVFENTVVNDKLTIVYCYKGVKSKDIVNKLRTLGYSAVSLKGGWNDGWVPYIAGDGGA